jgi:hypothetical protein
VFIHSNGAARSLAVPQAMGGHFVFRCRAALLLLLLLLLCRRCVFFPPGAPPSTSGRLPYSLASAYLGFSTRASRWSLQERLPLLRASPLFTLLLSLALALLACHWLVVARCAWAWARTKTKSAPPSLQNRKGSKTISNKPSASCW